MLTIVKISDSNAVSIDNAVYLSVDDNRLLILDKDAYKILDYQLPLNFEHSKRFFDIFLGNMSISNYIDIEKILEYNFKDVILEECQQEEELERQRQLERRRAEDGIC